MECELITQSTRLLLRSRRADSSKPPRRSKFRPVSMLFTGSSRSASRAFLELNSVPPPVPSSSDDPSEKLVKRYSLVLKKCTSGGRFNDGKMVHARMIRRGVVPDPVLWASLINFYAKCGDLASAQNVLDEMPERDADVFSWTALISGFVGEGCGSQGVEVYCDMRNEGVEPNDTSMVIALKGCSMCLDVEFGRQVHAEAVKAGLLSNLVVGNSLIHVYASCGQMDIAGKVFAGMPVRDDVSWSALSYGFIGQGCGNQGVEVYCDMRNEGVEPNDTSMVIALKGCSMCLDVEFGRQVHAEAVKAGLLSNLVVGNSLIHVYASCGQMDIAGKVFAGMPVRDVISWSALSSGFIGQGCWSQSAELYCDMRKAGVRPNVISVAVALKGCSMGLDLQFAKQVHSEVIKVGMLSDLNVGNSLIGIYEKCSELRLAGKVFSEMPVRNSMSWSALILGFVHLWCGREGFVLYCKMRKWNLMPDVNSLSAVLRGFLISLDVQSMKQVHAEAIKVGLTSNSLVRNYLNEIHRNCPPLDSGRPHRDFVFWNA